MRSEIPNELGLGLQQEVAMNMIHRVGLTISGVVALLVVVGVFVVQGYTSAQADAAQAAAAQAAAQQTAVQATPSPTASADATVDPLTIYVEPMPTPPPVKRANVAPPVVVVPKPQPAQPQPTPPQPTEPQPTPPVIHIVVTASPEPSDNSGGGDN
jgi:hypothetical protein